MAGEGSTSTKANLPSHADMVRRMAELEQHIVRLTGQLSEQVNQPMATGRATTEKKSYKMKPPKPFSGKKGKLQAFLTQAALYLSFYDKDLPFQKDKVLGIANLLEGAAFEWFEPRMREFLTQDKEKWSPETKKYFDSDNGYDNFTKDLQKVFGDVDEVKTAERKMIQLRQTGSAADYTAEFRKIESKIDWDENALIAQYYQGLKESLKDELARQERPSKLAEFIELAVRLDNRLYERKLERSGQKPTFGKKNQAKPKVEDNTWGDPMEIDTIKKRRFQKRHQRKPLTEEQKKWFEEKKCLNCGKPGHYARECRTMKQIKLVKKRDPDEQASKDAQEHNILSWTACYNDECKVHKSEKDGAGWYPRAPKRKDRESTEKQVASIASTTDPNEVIGSFEIPIRINGKKTVALIDSGAHMNLIDPEWVVKEKLEWRPKAQESTYRATGVNGGDVSDVTQEVPAIVQVGQHKEELILDVIPTQGHDVILGLPWLGQHNPSIDWKKGKLVFDSPYCRSRHRKICENPNPSERRIREVKKGELEPGEPRQPPTDSIPAEYRDLCEVFEEIRDEHALADHQPWDHEIILQEGKTPPYLPLYQLTESEQDELRRHVENNLRRGYIRPSTSSAGAPILFAPKKDGGLRLCVDYRKLNEITIKNRYPLPLIDEMRQQTSKAKIFTKLDIRDAYHQIRIKEGDEWKTAFRTRSGLYEYTVMPFGLTNAPASFQSLINNVLKEYIDKFVIVYLDDILVYSQTPEEHTEHVRTVLETLLERKLRLKLSKCEFGVTKTEYLGYIIEPGRISMDPKKLQSIESWPTPANLKELQSFLGTANYYRRFVKGYSKTATPLTKLAQKDQPFKWTEEQEDAFQGIKERMTSAPVLRMMDPQRPITVETDASDFAIGACMSQPDDEGRLHPVMFYSRKMTPAEQNYDIHDKELLAIVDTFREWRVYLQGTIHQVKVLTDHKNLTFFTTTKQLNRRQTRWAETLGQYNFKIVYQKGSENARADGLSRRPDYQSGGSTPGYQILKEEGDGLIYANQIAAVYRTQREVDRGILEAYDEDPMAQELLNRKASEPWIDVSKEGYIMYYTKIYVPASERKRIVQEEHEAKTSGHPNGNRTYDKVKRHYYWPKMARMVKQQVAECIECMKNKANRHKPYGLTQIPETPSRPWEFVTIDWINKLPKSKEPGTKEEFDSILVATDKLTKFARFIPYREASNAETLAYWFLKEIVANHGMPEGVISDRDKLLTSKFWQSLMKQLGSQSKMSTAYHPETNGQTERMNQTLEQYLRFYLSYSQNDWVELLPLAQFAVNSAPSETTGISPFEALYGYTPEVYHPAKEDDHPAQSAKQRVELMKEIHKQLREDIRFIAYKVAKYRDGNRLSAPTLREGDKVFLQRKNLRTKRPSRKLDHKKVGPFKIKRKISEVNFELELPKTMKIHPVFHASLLEPAPESAPLDRATTTTEEEYQVERILDYKLINGKQYYLVKWKDYSDTENTWEPKKNLTQNCSEDVEEFHRQNPTVGKKANQQEIEHSTSQDQAQEVHLEDQPVRRILIVLKTQAPTPHPGQLQLPSDPSPGSSQAHDEWPRPRNRTGPPIEGGNSLLESEAQQVQAALGLVALASPDGGHGQSSISDMPPISENSIPPLITPEYRQWLNKFQEGTVNWHPTMEPTPERCIADSDSETIEEDDVSRLVRETRDREISCAQSLSVPTKSHLRPLDIHSEHLSDKRPTRHAEPACLQREHGVDSMRPSATCDESLSRSTEEDAGRRGMVSRKRKWDIMDGDCEHHLYPEKRGPYNYGYRDESLQEEDQVLRNPLQEQGITGSDTAIGDSGALSYT
jgi:hypothetical protein